MPQVTLKDVRLSFPDLFEAKDYQNDGKFRYNATFLVEPGSNNDKAVRAALKAAAEEKFGKKADAILKSLENNSNKFCYLDGNTKEYDGYEDMMYIAAHRKQADGRPLIIDQQKQPLTAADGKPYAGCYVNALIDVWAQDGQNTGIRCTLKGVQFSKDGDSFSGSAAAKLDDFDEISEGADAADLV